MAVLLKCLRYVSFAVSIILILRMLRQYRKVRSVSRRSCVVAIVFPIATLLVCSVLIGSSLPSIALSALLAFGLALGVWQGRNTDVWVESGRPRARNTIWFLVVWGLSYTLMQVMVHLGNRLSLNIGIATMCVSTTIAVGSQGLILMRLSRPGGLPARYAAVRADNVRQGAVGSGAVRARSEAVPAAGRDLGAAGPATPASPRQRRYCSACGAGSVPGDRFCRAFGARIR